MIPAVRLDIVPNALEVDAPAGYDLDQLGAGLGPLWPDLVRALAPLLPPAEQWPEHWREAYDERAAIAAEAGAVDPEAVALADLRVMHWRELAAE